MSYQIILVTLPMGILIPPSMKAVIGITIFPSCLSANQSPCLQYLMYLMETPYRIPYRALKLSIFSGESTR